MEVPTIRDILGPWASDVPWSRHKLHHVEDPVAFNCVLSASLTKKGADAVIPISDSLAAGHYGVPDDSYVSFSSVKITAHGMLPGTVYAVDIVDAAGNSFSIGRDGEHMQPAIFCNEKRVPYAAILSPESPSVEVFLRNLSEDERKRCATWQTQRLTPKKQSFAETNADDVLESKNGKLWVKRSSAIMPFIVGHHNRENREFETATRDGEDYLIMDKGAYNRVIENARKVYNEVHCMQTHVKITCLQAPVGSVGVHLDTSWYPRRVGTMVDFSKISDHPVERVKFHSRHPVNHKMTEQATIDEVGGEDDAAGDAAEDPEEEEDVLEPYNPDDDDGQPESDDDDTN